MGQGLKSTKWKEWIMVALGIVIFLTILYRYIGINLYDSASRGYFDSRISGKHAEKSFGQLLYNLHPQHLDIKNSLISWYVRFSVPSFSMRESVQAPGGNAQSVPVLVYHGVLTHDSNYNIHINQFRAQMEALYEQGWKTISTDELTEFLDGTGTVPDKSFVLSFDDGRRDSYFPVDPILESLGFRATIFVIPQYSLEYDYNSQYYLSHFDINEMHKSGRWDIESHTWNGHNQHFVDSNQEQKGIFLANRLWNVEQGRLETQSEFRLRVRDDIAHADKRIKNFLGKQSTVLAYPFGNYGDKGSNFNQAASIVLEESKKIHKHGFVQVRDGLLRGTSFSQNTINADNFLVSRINVNANWTPDDLLDVLASGQPKDLPYSADMREYLGFFAPDGIIQWQGDDLWLHTLSQFSVVNAVLDGSQQWKDYTFDVVGVPDAEPYVELHGRIQKSEPFPACVFTGEAIKIIIKDRENKLNTTLASERRKSDLKRVSQKYSMTITDNFVRCENAQSTVEYRTEGVMEYSANGGVGVGIIQLPGKGEQNFYIQNISATPFKPEIRSTQL